MRQFLAEKDNVRPEGIATEPADGHCRGLRLFVSESLQAARGIAAPRVHDVSVDLTNIATSRRLMQ
jgi:hypothetical protein